LKVALKQKHNSKRFTRKNAGRNSRKLRIATILRVEPVTRRLSFSPMTPEPGAVHVNDITLAYVDSTVNANGQTTLKHLIATNDAFENLQERLSVRSWFEYI
jgi:hypothetical protein